MCTISVGITNSQNAADAWCEMVLSLQPAKRKYLRKRYVLFVRWDLGLDVFADAALRRD